MKRISLILALAVVLIVAFAASAYADYENFSGYNSPVTTVTGGTTSVSNWGEGTSSISDYSGNGLVTQDSAHSWGSVTSDSAAVYLPGDPSLQPIHSNYQANTDACSACHAVHTGNGDALTQWSTDSPAGITNVCMACHDGTVTRTYNVVAGTYTDENGVSQRNHGGLFAETLGTDATNASQHDVFSGLNTSAAYGGANPADIVNNNIALASTSSDGADAKGNWRVTFDCAACHTPHGQGANARILNPNPNGVLNDPNTGKPITTTDTVILDGTKSAVLPTGRALVGYPYSVSVTDQTANIGPFVLDYNYKLSIDSATGRTKITLKNGTAGDSVQVTYVPGIVVSMVVNNKLKSNESVEYTGGINAFCGACHTDYNTEGDSTSATVANGTYSQHTRHLMGFAADSNSSFGKTTDVKQIRGLQFEWRTSTSGYMVCLTCHYAHGTNKVTEWSATATSSGIAAYNTDELAGSSKLKRLPNMGVCESCHAKGDGAYSGDLVPTTGAGSF